MDWLNYHHLYYFYVITLEKSVTKASSRLRLAQSTLSAQLKQFEDYIGQPLFDRRGKAMLLTDMGQRVFQYADEIFRLGNELKDAIRDRHPETALKVQVGVLDVISKKVAEQVIMGGLRRHKLMYTILEGSLDPLLSLLDEHKIDFLISNVELSSKNKQKFNQKIYCEHGVVAVGQGRYQDLRKHFPDSLHGKPVILPLPDTQLRQAINLYFLQHKLEPEVVVESADLELQRYLAKSGVGIAFLPDDIIKDDLLLGNLHQLSAQPVLKEKIWLVSAVRKNHHPLVLEFIHAQS